MCNLILCLGHSGGDDDENDFNFSDDDELEFEEEMNDIIDENALFKNGNPLDNIEHKYQ